MYSDAQSAIFLAFNNHDLFIINVSLPTNSCLCNSSKGTNNFVGEN